MRLAGKVALVTGAGSIGPGWGNGKAASVAFAREGARVVAFDRNEEAASETAALVEGEGGECLALAGDVTSSADLDRAVAATLERFGRIDVLHNNVGIVVTGGVTAIDEATWDRVMAVNLKGTFLACRAVLPVMEQGGGGAIVNVSSVAGIRGSGVDFVAYSTSKGAILPLTRSIALEYARRGIRANAILPGLMNTPLVQASLTGAYGEGGDYEETIRRRDAQCPTGRMGDAWDVAWAAVFLASDEARYVTGTELVVDGGLSCRMA